MLFLMRSITNNNFVLKFRLTDRTSQLHMISFLIASYYNPSHLRGSQVYAPPNKTACF